MKKLILIAVLLAFTGGLFSQNQNTSIDSLANALSGRWIWTSSMGGFAGTTYTPNNIGYDKSIIFSRDSIDILQNTISFKNYMNDSIIINGRSNLRLSNMVIYSDTIWKMGSDILSDDQGFFYSLTDSMYLVSMNDTGIVLNDNIGDGYTHSYTRDSTYVLSNKNINQIKYSLNIYPNPASDFINIKTVGMPFDQLRIYNILGELMYCYKRGVTINNLAVDVSDYSSGIYIINIADHKREIAKMFIRK